MADGQRVDLAAYLARIGYVGAAPPTHATLARLHALHAEAIPFENLSPFLGEPVPLDQAALEDKMLRRRRGGWCFEHNLLFSRVLEALGYDVRRLAARVRWNVAPGVVTARTHMLLRVAVAGEPFLADVGFGGLTLTAPLRLAAGLEQPTPHGTYRLLAEGEGHVLEARIAGRWEALYAFEPHAQQLADYEVSNWYLATHPASQFVNGIVAARAEPGRRHALRNLRYAVHHVDGRTERRDLASPEELRGVLEGPLAIPVPDSPVLERKLAALLREVPAHAHAR